MSVFSKRKENSSFPLEFCRYLFIGGTNTLFTGGIYFFLLNKNCPYLIALIVSWFLGILFTYTFNYIWVFKPEQTFSFHGRFKRYITSYGASLIFNLISLHYLVEQHGMDPFYAQLFIMPFIIAFNYLATKFWSLKPKQIEEKNIDLPSQ